MQKDRIQGFHIEKEKGHQKPDQLVLRCLAISWDASKLWVWEHLQNQSQYHPLNQLKRAHVFSSFGFDLWLLNICTEQQKKFVLFTRLIFVTEAITLYVNHVIYSVISVTESIPKNTPKLFCEKKCYCWVHGGETENKALNG